MSYTSSLGSTPTNSPPSSLPSAPRSIQIGFSPSGSNAPVDIYPNPSTKSSQNPVCAYSSSSLNRSNSGRPSAYISDEDLFGDDFAPYLREAPPPPRPAQAWAIMPQPLLPPLTQSRRRSNTNKEKKRRTSSTSSKK